MEITTAVLYDGALAHYDVSIENERQCIAHLADFKGSAQNAPPEHIHLRKEGRRWVSDINDQSLSQNIGNAIETKVPMEVILMNSRRRDHSHPAA